MENQKNNWWQAFWAGAIAMKKLKLGTALDSILALCALISPIAIVAFIFTKDNWLLIIAVSPLLYFMRAYEHHMRVNPSMLRSEKHEEIMYRLSAGTGQMGKEIEDEELLNLEAETSSEAEKEGEHE